MGGILDALAVFTAVWWALFLLGCWLVWRREMRTRRRSRERSRKKD